MLHTNAPLRGLIIALFCLCGLWQAAHGQESHAITLSEALDLSAGQGFWRQKAEIESQLAQAKYKSIEAKWHPIISADAKILFWNDDSKLQIFEQPLDLSQVPAAILPMLAPMLEPLKNLEDGLVLRDQFTTTLGLQLVQPLTPLFQVYQAGELAKIGKNVAAQQQTLQSLSAELTALNDYLNLAYAQMMQTLASEAVQTIEALLTQAKQYEEAGLIAHSKVLEAELELLKAQQDLLEAQEGRSLAGAKLAQSINVERGNTLTASDLPQNELLLNLETLNAYQERALNQRAEFLLLRSNQEAKEREKTIALLDYVPKIALVGRYEFAHGIHMQPTHQAFIGLAVDWKLWDGLEAHYKAKQAALQSAQNEISIAESQRLVALEVEKNYLAMQSALQRQVLAQKALELAQENTRITQAQFDQGQSVSSELLTMHTKYSKSKADLIKTRIDILKALAALQISTGQNPNITQYLN